jgi:hypothetical protein
MSQHRNIMVAASLAATWCLALPGPTRAQDAEYDLRVVIERVLKWGSEAQGYNQYRWQKTRDELKDSIAQSTIKLLGVPVEASRIQVEGGRAFYIVSLDLWGGVTPDWPLSFSTGGAIGESMKSTPIRGTESYEQGSIRTVRLKLIDSADRLAMELNGRVQIDIFGRISSLRVDAARGALACEIEMTTWTARSQLEVHAAAKQLGTAVSAALAAGNWADAERNLNLLQKASPNDPQIQTYREAMRVAGRWSVSHDHGLQLFKLPGQTQTCRGVIEVRGSRISFNGSEHKMDTSIRNADIGGNGIVKGFHVRISQQEYYNFDGGPSTNSAILDAVASAAQMP